MITIKINNHSVDFFKDNRQSSIYQIRKEELGKTLEDSNFSLWINQLLTKNWMDKETLYEFIKIIQKEVPQNNINWESTFQIIESKYRKIN